MKIHFNLGVAVGLADLVFLFEELAEADRTSCVIVTILLYYFYMSVLTWMLIEGTVICSFCQSQLHQLDFANAVVCGLLKLAVLGQKTIIDVLWCKAHKVWSCLVGKLSLLGSLNHGYSVNGSC